MIIENKFIPDGVSSRESENTTRVGLCYRYRRRQTGAGGEKVPQKMEAFNAPNLPPTQRRRHVAKKKKEYI